MEKRTNYHRSLFAPQSLLDKLIDNHPEKTSDFDTHFSHNLQRFYEELRRDLENLLNTRLHNFEHDENFVQLKTSLYSYGRPNFPGNYLADEGGLETFCSNLTHCIKQFEPRFDTVIVSPVLNHSGKQSLQLRIQGTLHGDFPVQEIVFDFFLEDQTQAFTLAKCT